jgi:hypothetical protein
VAKIKKALQKAALHRVVVMAGAAFIASSTRFAAALGV